MNFFKKYDLIACFTAFFIVSGLFAKGLHSLFIH